MRMLIPSLLLLQVAAVSGCKDATAPVDPDLQAPSFSISDAAHDGAMTLGAELAAGHERGRLAMADAIILVSLLDANVEAIYTADAGFARYPGVEIRRL